MQWIHKLDKPLVNRPNGYQELEALIAEATICDTDKKYLLLVHDPSKCYEENWENVVRSFFGDDRMIFIEVQRPLSVELEVVLLARLPKITQKCSMMILMQNGAYVELPKGLYSNKVGHIQFLKTFSRCTKRY